MSENRYIQCEDEVPLVIPKRIMVLAGHPDDEIISCGGTIRKYQELGSEVVIIIATPGLGGYARADQKDKIQSERKSELQKVSALLKCEFVELGYSDLEISRNTISKITNIIRDRKPQVVLIPHFTDFHRVHRNLSFIAREAIYHCATGKAYGGHERSWTPLAVYYYESPSCKFQYIEGSVFVTVDIEKQWDKKKDIFNTIYASQIEVLNRVMDWAEDTAILRGNEIGKRYGEAYIPETTYTPLKILLM